MSEEEAPLAKVADLLQNVARPLIAGITTAFPIVVKYIQIAYKYYIQLPTNVIHIIVGCILCFFGGIYPTLFAAFQAAKQGGINELHKALIDLSQEALIIIEESKKDDKVDEDKDGIPDVEEIDEKELILRKANLVMTKINPAKIDNALQTSYTVWIAVIATLKVEFARTIALSLSISKILRRPADNYLEPIIVKAIPKEYKKWVPVLISWTTKSIGMSIAWFIQTIISAITSAWEGALIVSRAVLKLCADKGINPLDMIPKNHEDTNIDETLAYAIAVVGFYFQWKMGFSAPFPLNILLMPFEMTEYYIRWAITS